MKDKISAFISKQTCGNLAASESNGASWCFSFFYSFDEEQFLLHYKSSFETRHSAIIGRNPAVSGTILPDKFNPLQIKGIQFSGVVLSFDDPLAHKAASHYHHKHPVALAMPGEIWTIRLDYIKFTDNTLGFGKKLIWER